jgi:16S rRNA (cytosine967-C5)-methyltransferase
MIGPARLAAYRALFALSAGRTDLPGALASSRGALQDDRDRSLAAEIIIGVQRWRATLDHLIGHFSKRPLERLDPEVLEILRLSAYQLLYLTRVPAAAVVDDAVRLTERVRKRSARGLVNAVLRAISRSRRALPLPPRPDDAADGGRAVDYLAVTLSHPRWLARRWLRQHGFEATERWLQFNNAQAPLMLRVNRLKGTPEDLIGQLDAKGFASTRGRYAPDAIAVERGEILRGAAVDAGWVVVQDEASQLVALLAEPAPGTRVLDTCASPGGKTTAMSASMHGEGLLVACDVREQRMKLLRHFVSVTGARNVRLVQADVRQPLPFSRPFDTVLVDAPCSGLGTLRRDPDIKWRRREEDLPDLARAQLEMLQHASAVVAPGGRLVYATCSSETEENESVVEAFLKATPSFTRVDLRTAKTAVPAAVIDEHGHLRTYPHLHGLEAFFGAVLMRHPSI